MSLTDVGPVNVVAEERCEKMTGNIRRSLRKLPAAIAVALLAAGAVSPAIAGDHAYKILYSFQNQAAGGYPYASLISDKAGNLYGTTFGGGGNACEFGCGTVFKLTPDGTETVLHTFTGGSDGSLPRGSLIMDKAGNLYGTTESGGSGGGDCGCGTVFKLAPDGTETILYSFKAGNDGYSPFGGVIADKAGNLYGTTLEGGNGGGSGIVFKLAPDGTETVLHAFSGTDGSSPFAGLIADKAGNLYGTTSGGGSGDVECGCGVVFKVAPNGAETVLYSFKSFDDGRTPFGGLMADKAGNLYGTTTVGGSGTACSIGCGTVFKLAPDGTETILYAFKGGKDGAEPYGGVIEKSDSLYGTTTYGGDIGCDEGFGCGTVFRIASGGVEKVLHAFPSGTQDGYGPYASLLAGKAGTLYGAAYSGGSGQLGTVFELKK